MTVGLLPVVTRFMDNSKLSLFVLLALVPHTESFLEFVAWILTRWFVCSLITYGDSNQDQFALQLYGELNQTPLLPVVLYRDFMSMVDKLFCAAMFHGL